MRFLIWFIGMMVMAFFLTGKGWLIRETDGNERHEPPSRRQLRWDIRHLREDMVTLCHTNLLILVLLFTWMLFGDLISDWLGRLD